MFNIPNVYLSGDDLLLEFDVAGADPNSINIEERNGWLFVDARHERPENVRALWYAPKAYRGSARIPAGYAVDETGATYRNGVVTIRLKNKNPARRIPIHHDATIRQLVTDEATTSAAA